MRVSGVILPHYDPFGRANVEEGTEVAAYTCSGCGYIRLHDPRFVKPE